MFLSSAEEQQLAVDDYELVIKTRNDTPNVVMITTDDFQIRKKSDSSMLPKEHVAAIFPMNSITRMPIDFGRMRGKIAGFIPAEELDLTCSFKIDTAATDGGYSVVSKATYQCTVDKPAAEEAEQQYIAKEREDNRESMTDKELTEYIEYKTADFRLLDKKRYVKKDSFDFHIVSIGVYSPDVIVTMACTILIQKLDGLVESIEQNKLAIESFPQHFYEVTIPNDTFTMSKLIEFGLLDTYFERNNEKSILSFCAVKRSHPHNTSAVLRIATPLESTPADMVGMIKEVCLMLKENYKHIMKGVKTHSSRLRK